MVVVSLLFAPLIGALAFCREQLGIAAPISFDEREAAQLFLLLSC
jgi:hypothetical protein